MDLPSRILLPRTARRISPEFLDAFKSRFCVHGHLTFATTPEPLESFVINQAMARRFWPNSDPLNDHAKDLRYLLFGARDGGVCLGQILQPTDSSLIPGVNFVE